MYPSNCLLSTLQCLGKLLDELGIQRSPVSTVETPIVTKVDPVDESNAPNPAVLTLSPPPKFDMSAVNQCVSTNQGEEQRWCTTAMFKILFKQSVVRFQ
jgi:hypothetical protein